MAGFKPDLRNTAIAIGIGTTPAINAGALRVHLIKWLIGDNLPLTMATSPGFRAFLDFVNPLANLLLPRSANTTRDDLHWSVNIRRPAIESALAATKSKFHLVCDAWTSYYRAPLALQEGSLQVKLLWRRMLRR